MPAVTFTVRWPDGVVDEFYSPSTVIYQHLDVGTRYRVDDFFSRADEALTAASERVRLLKGFYCSAALDTLAALRTGCERFRVADGDACIELIAMRTDRPAQ